MVWATAGRPENRQRQRENFLSCCDNDFIEFVTYFTTQHLQKVLVIRRKKAAIKYAVQVSDTIKVQDLTNVGPNNTTTQAKHEKQPWRNIVRRVYKK
jgi:hypothetical protein